MGRPASIAAIWLAFVVAPAAGGAPPAGTESETRFCGTVVELDTWVAAVGVTAGDPYVGTLTLTQRDHDDVQPNGATSWDCVTGGACGDLRIDLPSFVLPQSAPEATPLVGRVESIVQTEQVYELDADLEGFVEDGSGVLDFVLLCAACGPVNDPEDIRPNHGETLLPIAGEVVVDMFVPGTTNSQQTDLRLSITRLGAGCNNALPASSPLGWLVLVVLLAGLGGWVGRSKRLSSCGARAGAAPPDCAIRSEPDGR